MRPRRPRLEAARGIERNARMPVLEALTKAAVLAGSAGTPCIPRMPWRPWMTSIGLSARRTTPARSPHAP